MRIFGTFALLCVLAFLPLAPVQAAAGTRIPALPAIIANYDIYVGGFHFINARILFQEEKGAYRTSMHAGTHGFWHDLLPWDAHLVAHGRMIGDHFVPVEFSSRDEWHEKPKITKLRFDAKGKISAEFDPPNTDKNREIVSEAQKRGSLDPISAMLQMLAHVAIQRNCNVTVAVFDGKRRFDVTGVDVGTEEIDEADYGFFKGVARTCDASFKMISGEWKDREPSKFWQKSETEAGREPFHIWLGTVGPGGTELPVRLESGSVVGLIIVHLTSWHYANADELKR